MSDLKMDKQAGKIVEDYRKTRGDIDSKVESRYEQEISFDDVCAQRKIKDH